MFDYLTIGKALKYRSGYGFEVACPQCGSRLKYLFSAGVSEISITGSPKNRFRCDNCQIIYDIELKYTVVQ